MVSFHVPKQLKYMAAMCSMAVDLRGFWVGLDLVVGQIQQEIL